MSKGARLGLVVVAVVIAVAAFLIAKPGDGDDNGDGGTPAAQTTEQQPTATAPSAPKPPPDAPEHVIELNDHVPAGGVAEIAADKGQRVTFIVDSDQPDDIHVHGYDIERKAAPGKPARFEFTADIEGIFEIESHEAEHAGKDALIAKLVVSPS